MALMCIWFQTSIYFRIKLKHIWKKWRKPLKDEIKKETFWKRKKVAKRDKVNATKAIRYYQVSGSLPRSRFCLVTQRSSLGWQVVTLTFVLVRTINITISWHNSRSLIVVFCHHYLRHNLCSYLSIFYYCRLLVSPPPKLHFILTGLFCLRRRRPRGILNFLISHPPMMP